MKRTFIARMAVICFAAVFWTSVAEMMTRWWIAYRGDALQRAQRILIADPTLGWRQRPFLATTFESQPLYTDANGFRISSISSIDRSQGLVHTLVLGPSSAFGWGVKNEETWANLIHQPALSNASQIGHSLVQGRMLYASIAPKEAIETVIIAFGVNDIDRLRFYGTDPRKDLEYFNDHVPKSFGLSALLNEFSLFQIMTRASQEAELFLSCGLQVVPSVRVPVDDFQSQLRDFVGELHREGKRVVLVNTATHMPFMPDSQKAQNADDDYTKSVVASQAGHCQESRTRLFSAKQNEPWRVLRDVSAINLAIEAVGQELRAPVADIGKVLGDPTANNLFVDPIHPSAEGHRIAAEVIGKAILQNRGSIEN